MAGTSRSTAIARQGALVVLALLAAAMLASVVPAEGRGAARPGAEAIVRFAPGVSAARRAALVRAAGGTVTYDLPIIGGLGVRLPAGATARLRGLGDVASVTLAAPVATRSVARPLNAYPSAVGATKLWDNGRGLTGAGVGVAVIDTGIDAGLSDFDLRRGEGSRVVADAVVNPRATTPVDRYGHGTHVAGIIAGDGAGGWAKASSSYIGVAPEADLINVKVADDAGRASTLDVIYGIQFAVDHAEALGIRVINLSLASTVAMAPANDPLDAAVESAWKQGLVVVAAAGNAGQADDAVDYAPANDPFVITVGATDDQGTATYDDDRLAAWSSRGRTQTGVSKPEVLAPGAHIVSTLARDSAFAKLCPDCIVDHDYFQAGGTSMSAAVVSGVAALLLQANPDWTPDKVKAALIRTSYDVPGAGREVRADEAVDADVRRSVQRLRLNPLVDPITGAIDYDAASWRAASWRAVEGDPAWAAASWRCDCELSDDGTVDPAAASWRAASWRVSFSR